MNKKLRTKRLLLICLVVILSGVVAPLATLTNTAQAYTVSDTIPASKEACVTLGGLYTAPKPGFDYQGRPYLARCQVPSTPQQDVTMLLSAGWLAGCLSQVKVGITAENLAGNILDGAGSATIGQTIDQQDGILECTNADNVTRHLAILGYGDLTAYVKAAGCKFVNKSAEAYSCPSLDSKTVLQKTVTAIYGAGSSTLKDYDKYVLARQAFITVCQATPIASPSQSEKNGADLNTGDKAGNTYRATMVDNAGTASKGYYTAVLEKKDTVKVDNRSLGWDDDGIFSCDSLANMTNTYAPSYITWIAANKILAGTQKTPPSTSVDKSTSSCPVKGTGWIVCPVVNSLSFFTDSMWGVVSNLLKVNPLRTTDKSSAASPIYLAWGVIRNLANVAFVVVFLIVIFSQLSNVGITNYGVKKMLPRLVVGAILVNLSFVIVQLAVDVANILGSSMYDLIVGLSPPITTTWTGLLTIIGTLGVAGAAGVTGAVAVGGAGAAMLMVLPLVAMGALGLLAAVFTLIVRQAIIPVLAILAPLAFVAYLLPNTTSWYKKWQSMLIKMLMLYPLAALVFAGAQFAAKAIINEGEWWSMLTGLVILTLPLFSLPFLARSGGSILGKVSGALGGLANKARSPINTAAKGARERTEGRRAIRALNGEKIFGGGRFLRTARRDAITSGIGSEKGRATQAYIANAVGTSAAPTAFANQVAGGTGSSAADPAALQRALLGAKFTIDKADAEEVKAAAFNIKDLNLSSSDVQTLAKGGSAGGLNGSDTAVQKAAMDKVLTIGTSDEISSLWDHVASQTGNTKERVALQERMATSPNRPSFVSGVSLGKLTDGGLVAGDTDSTDQLIDKAITQNVYSAEKMSTTDLDELKQVAARAADPTARAGGPSAAEKDTLADNANNALTDPILNKRLAKNLNGVTSIFNRVP